MHGMPKCKCLYECETDENIGEFRRIYYSRIVILLQTCPIFLILIIIFAYELRINKKCLMRLP